MNLIIKIAVSLFFLSFSVTSVSKGFESFSEAEEHISAAFKLVNEGDFEEGFSSFKPYWPIPSETIDTLIRVSTRDYPAIKDRLGLPLGFEKVCVESVGDSWKKISYIQKYENHSLLWSVLMYKPINEWYIDGVKYSDTWEDIFLQKCT